MSVLLAVLLVTSGEAVRSVLQRADVHLSTTDPDETKKRRDTGTVIGKIENILVLVLV